MATLQTPPSPAQQLRAAENPNSTALVAEDVRFTSPQPAGKVDAIAPTSPAARLPVELDVSVPVREFRVRNLLALELDMVIETRWGHEKDVPLGSGDVQLAWSEFEVVDTQLAVRVTRLA